MNSITNIINNRPSKIIGSLVLLYFYYYLQLGVIGYIVILLIIGFSIFAFFSENEVLKQGNERFHGDNLFFRYGKEIVYSIFSIEVKQSWSKEDTSNFANEMTDKIYTYFTEYFGDSPLNGKQFVNVIRVTDSEKPSDTRGFIKVSFTGSRGALFTRFITYQLVGRYVVLHRAAYLLGMISWYDLVFFFISSPLSIIFWIYSWIKGEYSIHARIARDIRNSFESLDIRAFYEASASLITNATLATLKENDLYSEETKMQIYNINGPISQYGDNNAIISKIK